MTLTTETLHTWLRHVAEMIHAQRDQLTALDAAIGDADHGANLDRGFTAVIDALAAQNQADAGALLKAVGMRLISTVGGASGPLYGTAFRRAGKTLEGYTELTPDDLLRALRAFVDGVMTMGKAEPGDKTMVDALVPAVDAFAHALAEGEALKPALHKAAEAAQAGAVATIPIMARRGRASYLGERSIGHQDPGATSAALMLRALADVV